MVNIRQCFLAHVVTAVFDGVYYQGINLILRNSSSIFNIRLKQGQTVLRHLTNLGYPVVLILRVDGCKVIIQIFVLVSILGWITLSIS